MAGSFRHLVAEDGSFTMDLIENLGDANEALEECYDMILWLAKEYAAEMRQQYSLDTTTSEVIADAWAFGHLADRRPDWNVLMFEAAARSYWNNKRGRPGQA